MIKSHDRTQIKRETQDLSVEAIAEIEEERNSDKTLSNATNRYYQEKERKEIKESESYRQAIENELYSN